MVGWADRELWQYGGLWPVQCMAGRGDQNPHNRTPGPATSTLFNTAGFTQERQWILQLEFYPLENKTDSY